MSRRNYGRGRSPRSSRAEEWYFRCFSHKAENYPQRHPMRVLSRRKAKR